MPERKWSLVFGLVLTLGACATRHDAPVNTVAHVDLPRFMGRWYVIASIPTFLEKNAFNATESYAQNSDGTVAVTFEFHKGSFDGPLKTMHPHGFIRDASNAVWGMQFIWPIKSEYRIAHLDPAYSEVVVARTARDFVWIMARTPEIPSGDYQRLVGIVKGLGYDIDKLKKVPQRWP